MNKVILGGYVKIKTGKLDANASEVNGKYPFFTCAREISRINTYAFDCECVLVAGNGELNVKYYEGKFNAYQRTYVIESLDHQVLSTKYLYYFIDSYMEKLRNGAIGGVIKYIKLNHLADIELPLPDLETQDKIVAILDKAKSLIEKREQTIQMFEEFLKATFLDMFGDPVLNGKELTKIKLLEVINKIDAGWSPVCEEKRRNNSSELAVLKLGAISKRFFDENQNKLLPKNIPIKKNVQAKKGNVLFSRKNTKELVGSTVYLFDEFENLLLPDTIFNLRYDKSKVSGIYLFYLFNDKNFRKTIQDLSSGAAASMSNISQEKLLNHLIPLPDLDLQLQFEKIVLNINENSQKKLNQSKSIMENLLRSLSQQAFRGDIVYDIDIDLEALVNSIDLEMTDEHNNIHSIKNDVIFIQRLIDKLNEQDFEDKIQYDKAKYIIFRIMKEEEDLIKQIIKNEKIQLTLQNETA